MLPDSQKKALNKLIKDFNFSRTRKEIISDEIESPGTLILSKTEFKNIYNRLIAYDGHEYHGAKSFYNNTGDERLTLVFFIDGITIEKSPYEVFKGKIDESIESEIRK